MNTIKVETTGGLVRLQRKSQSFVFPIDEAPALVQEMLIKIRTRTFEQQRASQVEMAGDTEAR